MYLIKLAQPGSAVAAYSPADLVNDAPKGETNSATVRARLLSQSELFR